MFFFSDDLNCCYNQFNSRERFKKLHKILFSNFCIRIQNFCSIVSNSRIKFTRIKGQVNVCLRTECIMRIMRRFCCFGEKINSSSRFCHIFYPGSSDTKQQLEKEKNFRFYWEKNKLSCLFQDFEHVETAFLSFSSCLAKKQTDRVILIRPSTFAHKIF